MKALVALSLLFLTACSTTIPVTKYVMPTAPDNLMVAPANLQVIPQNPNGSADPKVALTISILNNGAAQTNADRLAAIQKWITDTKRNIDKGGKP